jgi:hypothetical protein
VFRRDAIRFFARWAISDYGHGESLLNAAQTVFREQCEYDNSGLFTQRLGKKGASHESASWKPD